MENKIIYKKPKLQELTKEYTVVDPHFHSRYSDGINTIPTIVKHAKKLGIGIAITDHNEIKGAIEIDKYKGLLTIPGIEVTAKEGSHILIYFYDAEDLKKFYKDYIKPNMGNDIMSSTKLKMELIIKYAKRFKTVIIFPHPYSAAYTGVCNHNFNQERLKKLFSMVHGLEAINSENLNKWNMNSSLLAFNVGKAITGGSDGHTLYHMGKVVTYAKCKSDRTSFLNAIKKKQTKVIGKEIDMLRKVTSNSFKLRKNLKNYPDLVEKNIKYSYSLFTHRTKKIKDFIIKR
ncbi:MAG: PHP domain-containing protein [Candidatus Woesearchaeota archaeon]